MRSRAMGWSAGKGLAMLYRYRFFFQRFTPQCPSDLLDSASICLAATVASSMALESLESVQGYFFGLFILVRNFFLALSPIVLEAWMIDNPLNMGLLSSL